MTPSAVAQTIFNACASLSPELRALQTGRRQDGESITALGKQIRSAVRRDAAPYVHWGARTQDILDTALVL